MRKAISYCEMRVWISGSPKRSKPRAFSLIQRIEHGAAVVAVHAGGILDVEHGIARAAQRDAVEIRGQKAAAPHAGEKRLAISEEGKVGVSTTKAGRSLLSLPRPYASQEPMLALPACSLPVMTKVQAGSWLIAFVWTLRTRAISSTIFAVCGSTSLIHGRTARPA
jgi:hypothetical protein